MTFNLWLMNSRTRLISQPANMYSNFSKPWDSNNLQHDRQTFVVYFQTCIDVYTTKIWEKVQNFERFISFFFNTPFDTCNVKMFIQSQFCVALVTEKNWIRVLNLCNRHAWFFYQILDVKTYILYTNDYCINKIFYFFLCGTSSFHTFICILTEFDVIIVLILKTLLDN